ncbi:hypothetical protein D3C87_1394300 [compost metagenome]
MAKKSGGTRASVASHATALTPFSQNSKEEPCSGSPHAQPGQSNPSGWFAFSSVRAPEIGAPDSISRLPTLLSAPQPPAAAEALPMKSVLLIVVIFLKFSWPPRDTYRLATANHI